MKATGGRRWAPTPPPEAPSARGTPGWGTAPGRRARGWQGSRRRRQGGTPGAGRLCTGGPTADPSAPSRGQPRQKPRPGVTSCPGGPAASGSGRGPGRRRPRGFGGASWAQRAREAREAREARGQRTWSARRPGWRARRHGGRRAQGGLPRQEGERAGAPPDTGPAGGGGRRLPEPSPQPALDGGLGGPRAAGGRGPGSEGGFGWNRAAGAQTRRRGPPGQWYGVGGGS